MVDKGTLRVVLDMYLGGQVSQQELSKWAYELVIQDNQKSDDPLITEILYSLVSFQNVGFIFNRFNPTREKLEYFVNWLDNEGSFNWDHYTSVFDPGKLI